MGFVSGPVTFRRFRVEGEFSSSGWRERVREQLQAMAYREPPGGVGREEVEGWVLIDDLLETSFDDMNRWFPLGEGLANYVVFALRVDKKSLPSNLLRATVEKRARAWAEERQVQKCPASEKKRIKEELEDEWLARSLPRVGLTEVAWHVQDRFALIGSTSEKACDRVRERFYRTFGLALIPWAPLDGVQDTTLRHRLLASAPGAGGRA